MGHCRAVSPSPISSSRDACWPPHCSPSSSSPRSVRQKKYLPGGICIRIRTEGSLFNFWRLLAQMKTVQELITELLFADDCALRAHTEETQHHVVNRFSDVAKNFGLTISLKKTEVTETNPLREKRTVPLTSASMAPKRSLNISLVLEASSPMMPQSVWILTTTCPKPAIPWEDCQREYGKVTRSVSSQRSRYREPSSFSSFCTMQTPGFSIGSRLGYLNGFTNAACAPSWASSDKTTCQTKKSSREPDCPAQSPSCSRCSCAGLTTSQGWPKTVLFSELKEGKCGRGAPRKRYEDQLKRQLAQKGINHQSWHHMASGRKQLALISEKKKISRKFEAERHEAAKERRRRQKKRGASQLSSARNLRLSKVQQGLRIKSRTLKPPTSIQKQTINPPQNPRLRGIGHQHHHSTEKEKMHLKTFLNK